jgi:TM2 domain-containing membrane protein YozV
MNCANHSDTAAAAFCRTCGKPLCANCTRDVRGVIYCESCLAARMEGTAPTAPYAPPQTPYQQIMDQGLGLKVPPGPTSGPNPAVAGILAGFFPFGVGAVYCSQYAKGLAHLLIFALLIFGVDHAGRYDWVFGFAIAFFYVYQIIDSVRTAQAMQAGRPTPDPLGLSQAFGAGDKLDAGKVPVGAVVLIGLGILFLLHTMGFEYGFDRFWPLIIVFLGAWMFYRHWDRTNRTCTCARCRTRWLMGPVLVLTTGFLLLLASTDVAELDRTWPAWLLVVGVVKLIQSSASSEGHVGPLPPGPAAGTPVPPATPVSPTETSSGEVRNV